MKQIPLRRRFCEGDQSLGQLVNIDYLFTGKSDFDDYTREYERLKRKS